MAEFSAEERQLLDGTDEVQVGFKPEQRIPIWIAVDGDHVYVRSVRGTDGKWYQALSAGRPFTLRGGSSEWSIVGEHVSDQAEIDRVSEAFNRKYQSRWPGPTAAMLRTEVLPTTLRITPA